jgi:outer membrane protein TolC
LKKENILLSIVILTTVVFSREYTLVELVDSVYKHSDRLKIATYKMEKNSEEVKERKSDFLPSFGIGATYGYAISSGSSFDEFSYTEAYLHGVKSPQDQDVFITSMMDQTASMLGGGAPKNSLALTAKIHQNIYSQGKVYNMYKMSELSSRGLICHWQEVRMEARAEITRLYYRALLAEKDLDIRVKFEELLGNRHQKSVDYFKASLKSELDTLNSFLDLTKANIKMLEARRGRDDVFRTIVIFTKLEEPAESVSVVGELEPMFFEKSIDEVKFQFLQENKTLTQLRNQVDILEYNIKFTQGNYYPTVFGGIDFGTSSQFDSDNSINFLPQHQLFLGVNYDLFTFGKRGFKVEQSRYDKKIAERELGNSEKRLTLSLERQFALLEEKRIRMSEGEQIETTSKKAYEISIDSYESNLISSLEVQDSETKLLESHLYFSNAIFEYNSALIDLRIMMADYLYVK